MSDFSNLLSALSSVGWLLLAVVVAVIVMRALKPRWGDLTKFGAGPSGVTMEFAEKALDAAVAGTEPESADSYGAVAKRGILARLARNADLLSRARLVWVDDHPENNTSIVELLTRFGATVDTPTSNDAAIALMEANRYDVVLSDVGRDQEGNDAARKGITLATAVFDRFQKQTILFTARFDPLKLPGATDAEKIALAIEVNRTVFGRTNRYDEVLHLILDVLERGL